MKRYVSQYIATVVHAAFFSCLAVSGTGPLGAEEGATPVAVAANFTEPAKQIAAVFETETGHHLLLSFGSTGKFYAQIKNAAPFEILLSADQKTPERLVEDGLAVADSRFTYAVGRLVLWSAAGNFVDEKGAVLRTDRFRHLAIANPKLAPYGIAAEETLTKLGLLDSVRSRFVLAENLPQAYQFVASGSAEIGFLALAQLVGPNRRITEGSHWLVPSNLHSPIKQDAVILVRGKGRPVAAAFLEFLKGVKARRIIRNYGYEI